MINEFFKHYKLKFLIGYLNILSLFLQSVCSTLKVEMKDISVFSYHRVITVILYTESLLMNY